MGFSAIIPVDRIEAANVALESGGFGPDNLSVPLRQPAGQEATHGGLNMVSDIPAFRAAVGGLPEVSILDVAPGQIGFQTHVLSEGLDWSEATTWGGTPTMAGGERVFEGQLWVSDIDENVWQPPYNWTLVPTEEWSLPTGFASLPPDMGLVRHSGQVWKNASIIANLWEPGIFGWERRT